MVAPMSKRRCGVGVAVLHDLLYAVGGHDGQSYLNSIERYDPQTNQVRRLHGCCSTYRRWWRPCPSGAAAWAWPCCTTCCTPWAATTDRATSTPSSATTRRPTRCVGSTDVARPIEDGGAHVQAALRRGRGRAARPAVRRGRPRRTELPQLHRALRPADQPGA
ncbi:uncharacterized protein LOC142987142 [Anticarsia gemmatalis]|uniref:uncharacterized protein LOC142987142 n=1 Tax=Anticarsia gemmatalis TaxID=129554 RepID=UPI003F76A1D0